MRCICSLFIILQVSLDYECVRSNLILAYLLYTELATALESTDCGLGEGRTDWIHWKQS